MSGPNPDQHLWEHETFVRRFELAWRAGPPPRLDDFLPADADAQTAVLMELACTDLEYRLKAGLPARVEDYQRRYPQLADHPTAVLALIDVEIDIRRRAEADLSLDEYRQRFPELSTALPVEFARLTRDGPASATAVPAEPDRLPAVPGYDMLGVLGRGGMGVVYQARQRGLNRLVALKMIRAGRDDDPEVIRRFQAEAEAVARLQHPNIVQVYEVGEHEGRPYFSLEYVPGGSLAGTLGGVPQPARLGAELVETLARAVAAAHRAGIIHRDLKPANVLLTSGVPKIADFGLAKRLEDGPGQTHTGAVLGTPSYMAPEQAAGRVRDIGPATDVYALGAILYECLTGRPPFRAATAWDTVAQVIADEPVPPARLQPAVPPDLDTVCLKCLEKEPDRRYASADELADDVGRYLRGEPVRARPVSAAERLWRWARRNRRVAALVAALFGVLVSGLTAVTVLWLLAESRRQTAEAAIEQVRQERIQTAAAQTRRKEALDDLTAQESLDWLTAQKKLSPRQEAFLKRVLEHYQEFAALAATDEEGQKLVADAAARVGNILQALGRITDAEPAYRQAAATYERLAGEYPATAAYPYGQANSLGHLARLLFFVGRRAESVTTHRAALALRERLARDHPDVPRYREKVVDSLRLLAEVLRADGHAEQAKVHLQQAVQLSEQLTKAHPSEPNYRHEQSLGLSGLANVLTDVNQFTAAATAYQQALALSEPLTRERPAVAVYRQQVASCCQGLAFALVRLGQTSEAEQAYRRGRTELERLAAEDPGVAGYRQELADNLTNHANLLAETNRKPDAIPALRRAAGLYERLAADQPAIPEYRQDLARCLSNLGNYLIDVNQRAEAGPSLRRALALREQLVRDDPKALPRREELGSSYYHLGKYAGAGDRRGAVEWYGQAIDTLTAVLGQNSEAWATRHFLSAAHVRRAEALNELDRPADALPDWDRAVALAGATPDPGLRLGRAWTQARVGAFASATAEADALAALNDTPAATLYQCARIHALATAAVQDDADRLDRQAARAVELLRRAVAAGYKNVAFIKADPALDSLRGRADFQKVLAKLEAAGREQ